MKDSIFQNFNHYDDPYWIVKEYFNLIHEKNIFLEVAEVLVKKMNYTINEQACLFPVPDGFEGAGKFQGVKFTAMDNFVVISESKFECFLREACENYIIYRSQDKLAIESILRELKT